MQAKELTSLDQMMKEIATMQFLYPKITHSKYESYLTQMIQNNYTQIAIYDNGECIGLSGCWYNVKLWSGKYLEIDNFIIHPEYRKKGIGKIIVDYIQQKALNLDCNMIVLDAYTTNFDAHRFYYNQGFVPKGFHFIKILDENALT
jgi:GNAT superfamily N-acetyltransferase